MKNSIKTKEECLEALIRLTGNDFDEVVEEVDCGIKAGDVFKYNNKIYYLRQFISKRTYIKEDTYEKTIKKSENRDDPFHSENDIETIKINSPDMYVAETYNVFICDFTFSKPQIQQSKKTFNLWLGKYSDEESHEEPTNPTNHIDKEYVDTGNELQTDRFIWGSPMYAKSEGPYIFDSELK